MEMGAQTLRFRLVCAATLLCGGGSLALGQNLVGNGTFARDFTGWQTRTTPNGTAVWSAEDANGATGSGSAFFTTTHPNDSEFVPLLTQCVPVVAGESYVLSQEVKFQPGETTPGAAQIVLTWSSSPDCQASLFGIGLVTERSGAPSWFADSQTFPAPAGAVAASIQLGMDKDQAGGTLSAWVDNVSFVPVSSTTDALAGYLPVVGSVAGSFGSNFKTSVQLLNPASTPIGGRLVFHPAGRSAGVSDPSLGFVLGPGQSFAWDDIVEALGETGLGSLDVYATAGTVPIVLARIFDDAGAAGTSGFTEPLFETSDVVGGAGLVVTGFLIGPADVDRFRYNVGVRTLDAPVHVTVDVLDPSGAVVHAASRTYLPNFFQQTSVADFTGGFPPGDGQALKITFTGGPLIVYGATVDNVTNDPSAQFLAYRILIS